MFDQINPTFKASLICLYLFYVSASSAGHCFGREGIHIMAFNWVACAKMTLLILLIAAIIFACFTLPVKKVSFFFSFGPLHFHYFLAFRCFCFFTWWLFSFVKYILELTQVRTQRTKCCAFLFMLLYVMLHALGLNIWYAQFYGSHMNLTYLIIWMSFLVISTMLYCLALGFCHW